MCDAALTTERWAGDRGEKLLEFCKIRTRSWRHMYKLSDVEDRRYVAFILRQKDCIPGSRMVLFQQYWAERRARDCQLSRP